MLMKKLLIALTGIMMMGMMTNCNESKPVADSQQQEVKASDQFLPHHGHKHQSL